MAFWPYPPATLVVEEKIVRKNIPISPKKKCIKTASETPYFFLAYVTQNWECGLNGARSFGSTSRISIYRKVEEKMFRKISPFAAKKNAANLH